MNVPEGEFSVKVRVLSCDPKTESIAFEVSRPVVRLWAENSASAAVAVPGDVASRVDLLVGKHGFASRDDVVAAALRDLFKNYIETTPSSEMFP